MQSNSKIQNGALNRLCTHYCCSSSTLCVLAGPLWSQITPDTLLPAHSASPHQYLTPSIFTHERLLHLLLEPSAVLPCTNCCFASPAPHSSSETPAWPHMSTCLSPSETRRGSRRILVVIPAAPWTYISFPPCTLPLSHYPCTYPTASQGVFTQYRTFCLAALSCFWIHGDSFRCCLHLFHLLRWNYTAAQ